MNYRLSFFVFIFLLIPFKLSAGVQPSSALMPSVSCHGDHVPSLKIWQQLAQLQQKRLVMMGRAPTIACHFDAWSVTAVKKYLLQNYPFSFKSQAEIWLVEVLPCPILSFTAQHRPIKILLEWLRQLSTPVQPQSTWLDEPNNTLFFKACQADTALTQLKKWDQPQPQIAIEAKIIATEVKNGEYLRTRLGWKWGQGQSLDWSSSADTNHEIHGFLLPKGLALDLELGLLTERGDVHILARPELVTSVGHPAEIAQGEEIPYQSATESGATHTSFKKAVLGLAVVPWLRGNNTVHLQLTIHKDSPIGDSSKEPVIQTNKLTSEVDVPSGRTLAVGGIFTEQKTNLKQDIPFFGKIPLIGWLFRAYHHEQQQREMIIFITPHLLK